MAAPRDNFGRLPWMALGIIICNLPDLPSIFRLLEASESSKSIVLSQIPNLVEIIENNINRPVAEGGLHPENKILLRLFALISWRTFSGLDDNNLLPRYYQNVIPALANTFSMAALSFNATQHRWSTVRSCFASQPLHNSIPPIVIYQLLHLSAQAQQISHGCFHDCMTRCMSLPLRQLKPDESATMDLSFAARPAGTPLTPVNLGPPTYWEEQRLLQTTLRFFLFWDLKDAVEYGLLIMKSHADDTLLKTDNVEDYWCKSFHYGRLVHDQRSRMFWSEVYQMKAFLTWAKACNPGVPLSRNCLQSLLCCSPSSMPCCPLTPAAPGGFVSGDMAMVNGVPPGWSILASLQGNIQEIGEEDLEFFSQFGFDFWDHERLLAFGLTKGPLGRDHALGAEQPNVWQDLFQLAFVWSSILPAPRWRISDRNFVE
ncbi:hypothetical protein N7508_003373 [Penicillium antarcticum]|uniref:uncharacterized protein n=1 Tax=Penicillium antarcticum TaxID=416450 RepID=UPI002396EED5|nr:uncharacterized protein N7508_003373 [Penicillium antarcticum]KAJ5312543.1 hypothetical protein N7508_003373 [Penicillium antarcticum]